MDVCLCVWGGEGKGGERIATGLLGKGEGGSPQTFELAIVSQFGFFFQSFSDKYFIN